MHLCHGYLVSNLESTFIMDPTLNDTIRTIQGELQLIQTKVVKNAFLTRHGRYNINSTRKLES